MIEENFFFVKSFIIDLCIDNIQNINQQLGAKVVQYTVLSNQNPKKYLEESFGTRIYIENAQNEKQIKDNYDQVSKATFIDSKITSINN